MHHPTHRYFLGAACPLILSVLASSCHAQTAQNAAPMLPPVTSAKPLEIEEAPYNWRLPHDNAGGNCIGLAIHPLDSNVRYVASGDTGGYRWDATEGRWLSFTDWNPNLDYGYMVGVAVDPTDKNIVYYAAGHPNGEIFKSTDGGRTFTPAKLQKPDGKPVYGNGGENPSDSGEDLVVDPNNPQVVYFISRLDGLWRSTQGAAPTSFARLDSFTARGDVTPTFKADGSTDRRPNGSGGLTFIALDKGSGTTTVNGVKVTRVLYLSVIGDRRVQTEKGGATSTVSEGGIWRSSDGGQSWTHLSGPDASDNGAVRGYVASDGALITTSGGKVCRATRTDTALTDLKAPTGGPGYFAVAVDPADPKHIVATRNGLAAREASYDTRNTIVRTTDGGATWTQLKATYNSPGWWNWFFSYNHWLTFDPNSPKDAAGRSKVLWGGDWIGPWQCQDIGAPTTHWDLIGQGRGGTYSLAIATPPAKPGSAIAPVFMQGADFDGFRYNSLSSVPLKRLTQSATGVNDGLADGSGVAFCESDPNFVAAVGGWDHGGNGGGGASTDNGKSWTPFAGKGLSYPGFGQDPKLGRVAVGATKGAGGFPILIWIPRFQVPRYSLDWGKSWTDGTGAPKGMTPSEWESWQTLAADPVDGNTFYALDNNSQKTGNAGIYKTTDGGKTWNLAGGIKASWNQRTWAKYQLKAMPGKSGDLWLSLIDPYDRFPEQEPGQGFFHSTDGGATWTRIAGLHPVSSFAFGAPAPGHTNPSLVVAGRVGDQDGLFVSDDATGLTGDLSAATWKRIWNHQTSEVKSLIFCQNSLGADRQVYGRIYAGAQGTGRGMFYGDLPTIGAPATPRNLEVAVDFDGARLQWTDPLGAKTYNLYRTAGNAKPSVLKTLNESTYLDTDLQPGTLYSYRVEALNPSGKSPLSESIDASPFVKITPQARFGSPGLNGDTFDKATDGNLSTAFDATSDSGAFTGFDAGAPVVATRLRFQPRDWNGKRMTGGLFQGAPSQDGPWTTLYTVQGEPATNHWSDARLSNTTPFRFYRYLSPEGGHANIKEMELYTGGTTP